MRAARLWSGAGQAFAAERLHAHDRADLIAIHIGVSGMDMIANEFRRVVDAAVHAKRETVAGGVDGFANLLQPSAGVAYDMKNGAEHLSFEHRNGFDFE